MTDLSVTPLGQIPEHLLEYTTQQNPDLYTPIDHATWRFVMRVSKVFFKDHAHPLYLKGLEITGIATDRIPLVSEMDEALKKLGWRAVAINGFIPPSVFLEFQSLRILAIACDIRKLENIGYTPSPDIIHEAAGHAPIVADPAYRTYLEAYGEVARNAIISKFDLELYEAIFKLSEIKEDPHSTPEAIAKAQAHFEKTASRETIPSEAALLTRMAWWTTEYGLIGDLDYPLVYGAGLLSSVLESFHCFDPQVKKIPFSLKATIETSYDITRPQPQLFVAKSFEELTTALDEFANQMAFRLGGAKALQIAQTAENTVTVVFENGIQLTGLVENYIEDSTHEAIAFTLGGRKQFSYHDLASEEIHESQLNDSILFLMFDPAVSTLPLEGLQRKLHSSGLHANGGYRIQGRFQKEIYIGAMGRLLLLDQVKIYNKQDEIIFQSHLKLYPLILGSKVVSVFGGAADRKEFALRNSNLVKKVTVHETNLTQENFAISKLYQRVRDFRNETRTDVEALYPILNDLNETYPEDWLLRMELLELYHTHKPESVITAQLRRQLQALKEKNKAISDLIQLGLSTI